MSFLEMLLLNQTEIITLSIVAVMMAISPGADFVLVTRNSLSHSRQSGLYTALGITVGTLVHISYCIAGLAIVINASPFLYSAIKYLGALYLIFIGISTINTKRIESDNQQKKGLFLKPVTAFASGFISNALNPKTTLFFLGIFTQLVDEDTPLIMQMTYGFIISLAHLVWFSLLSYLITHQKLLPKVKQYQIVINGLMGVTLVGLGLKLILF